MKKLVNRIDSCPDWKIAVFLYFAFAVPMSIAASFLRVPVVNDTVSTLADAALLAGDDWSFMVKLYAAYYKPGIAILYFPLYLLFRSDPVMMYRTMCIAGMLMVAIVPVCAYAVLRRHLETGKVTALLTAAASAGLSSVWLYSSYPKGEVLLILLPLPVLLVLLELCRGTESRGRRIALSVLLAFLLTAAYLGHTRGIVLIIAAFMVCGMMTLTVRDRKTVCWPALVLSFAVFFLAASRVSALFKERLFIGFEPRANTLSSFSFGTLLHVFSPSGFLTMARLCVGWVYNLVVSTYGLAVAGVIGSVWILWQGIVHKRMSAAEQTLASFSLLYTAGCFAMGILFFYPSAWAFVQGTSVKRADRLFYGRYMATAVPSLMMTAFYVFCVKKEKPEKALRWIVPVFAATAVVFLGKVARPYVDSKLSARYFISLTTFLQYDGIADTWHPDLISALTKITLVNGAVLLVFLFLVCRKRKFMQAVSLILIASAINFTVCFVRIRMPSDAYYYNACEQAAQKMQELEGDSLLEDYPKVAVDGGSFSGKVYQFLLPGLQIGKYSYFIDDQPEFIAITKPSKIKKLIGEWNARTGEAPCCVLYQDLKYKDAIYVRGEHLIALLREHGYDLKEVSVSGK